MSDILFASLLQFPTKIYRSADLFSVLGDPGSIGTPMHLREISREGVLDVGLCEGLFWVRRVERRVNISLPDRKTAGHLFEKRSPYSFDGIRKALRTTQYFPL